MELEEAWLAEAGLSSLVTGSSTEEATPPTTEALLSTLTRQQAATVRRRLDKYNETLKTRNRQPIRDVREVFTQVGAPLVFEGSTQLLIISYISHPSLIGREL